MSNRDKDPVRLRHMLRYAKEAVETVQGINRTDLDHSRLLQLAIVRLIEVVGEAAARVTRETQQDHPNVPWPQITGIRNRLIHGYDVVDLDIVWETVTRDFPLLITQLERIIPADDE